MSEVDGCRLRSVLSAYALSITVPLAERLEGSNGLC